MLYVNKSYCTIILLEFVIGSAFRVVVRASPFVEALEMLKLVVVFELSYPMVFSNLNN